MPAGVGQRLCVADSSVVRSHFVADMTLLLTAAKTGGSARRMPVSSSSSRAAQASHDCVGGKQAAVSRIRPCAAARVAHLADLQMPARQRPVARAVGAQALADEHFAAVAYNKDTHPDAHNRRGSGHARPGGRPRFRLQASPAAATCG